MHYVELKYLIILDCVRRLTSVTDIFYETKAIRNYNFNLEVSGVKRFNKYNFSNITNEANNESIINVFIRKLLTTMACISNRGR